MRAFKRRGVAVVALALGLVSVVGSTPVTAIGEHAATTSDDARKLTTATVRQFGVAPAPYTIIGGIYQPRRTCKSSEVNATAETRRAPDGVVAVAVLTTDRKCDIHVGELKPTLYDAQHNPLDLPVVDNPDTANPASNEGWIPKTTLGFAWDGSWCGPDATTVSIPLTKGAVEATFNGPEPKCTGTSASTIIPGAFGNGREPVQGAPPEWRFLTTSFHVPAVTRSPSFVHPRVTFTNSSDQPVVLRPFATYGIGVRDKYGDGTEVLALHPLRLAAGADTVPADGLLTVKLPSESIVTDYRNLRGRRVTATFSMAGVPDADATSRLNHASLTSYEGGHCRLDGRRMRTFTTYYNKECDSLPWRFVTKPTPATQVLHVRWHGYCASTKLARGHKRETKKSVVVGVADIVNMNPRNGHCSVRRGKVAIRLSAPLGSRHIHHAATEP
ncbi:MAG TPA: hypothetical protein VMH41_02025 [Mycobacteriales bacterium]|nr:hypothetical protein [Mycobacteriales bacterium]